MLDAAGYTPKRQYESLFKKVPYMGPKPGYDGSLKWQSFLGSDPAVRYTIEPINQFTDTAIDPLNQQASIEMLHRLEQAVPSVDLTWANHFIATLYDHDRHKYTQEAAAGAHFTTTTATAAELVPQGVNIKTYFLPRRLGQTEGRIPMAQWEESLAKLDPNNQARATLHEFLNSHSEGEFLEPIFDSVREIMTLGGRIAVREKNLEDLRSLIAAATGLDEDYPADQEIPCPPGYDPVSKDNFKEIQFWLSGYQYYFDIAPGAVLPDIKFYTTIRRYGSDDRSIARGIMGWMESHGRGAYTGSYLSMLEALASHRKLEHGTGLQAFISCLFTKDGELDITTYIGAEAFAPGRINRGAVNGHRANGANGTNDHKARASRRLSECEAIVG
ncbi:dimethylallyl tryptophan synthase GliD1 [Biscogniauxia marginata]|nr:dimethylallyl tryptophan synthase GliD1 [Biscogniauxia marginata]